MKQPARPFWWPEEISDAASARAELEACREWTPFLTALFDGEADENEALAARRHLLVCERCARAWLDWNQTRHLFLQLAEPPAPPPNLLWRIALACRLARPMAPSPRLSAQILKHTSRREERPTLSPMWMPRGLPLPGVLALCAFALLLTRAALAPPPAPSDAAASAPLGLTVRASEASDKARALTVSADAELPILPSHVVSDTATPRSEEDSAWRASGADKSLVRAHRELDQLPMRALSIALPAPDAPLPMLRERPSLAETAPRRAQSPRTPRAPHPVASATHFETPAVVLTSAPVSPSDALQSPGARGPRVLLASLEAPLRISPPRVRPLTLTRPIASDDSGLDEVDSTVQDYRATLIDAPDMSSDGK